jgi:hypothetical protein
MYHPLLSSPSDLKVSDLEDKINELSKKYFYASRSGNGELARQILVVLEMFKTELQSRNRSTSKIPTKDGESDLDDLINIS